MGPRPLAALHLDLECFESGPVPRAPTTTPHQLRSLRLRLREFDPHSVFALTWLFGEGNAGAAHGLAVGPAMLSVDVALDSLAWCGSPVPAGVWMGALTRGLQRSPHLECIRFAVHGVSPDHGAVGLDALCAALRGARALHTVELCLPGAHAHSLTSLLGALPPSVMTLAIPMCLSPGGGHDRLALQPNLRRGVPR